MVSLQPRVRYRQKPTSVVGASVLIFAIALVPKHAFAENTVTRWAEHAMQAVRAGNVGTPNAGRLYAMVTVAMYDAVNGIDSARHRGREHALVRATGAPRGGSRSAAAAAAAHAVLVALVSSQTSVLDLALAEELAAARDGDVAAGQAWGESVGEQVVLLRSTDGTQAALTIPAGTGIGEHRAAFDARFRNMTLFGIRSKTPYVAGPPPALTSDAYTRAFNDVKMNGEQDGDPERNEIALFWLAEANTVRETGTWIQATVAIVEQQGTDKSLSDTARLFARVGMAIADAVTVVWETKAIHFTWRPFFAIREADADPNPDTIADVTWTPRNVSIGASPEYNSGTSAFAGAASAVIEAFYWPRRVSFCFASDGAPNGDRCYASPLAGALEAGRSRIYQGIHFQFANDSGRRAGRRIGTEVALTRLRFCVLDSRICLP
jgi:PAP2 superfamily